MNPSPSKHSRSALLAAAADLELCIEAALARFHAWERTRVPDGETADEQIDIAFGITALVNVSVAGLLQQEPDGRFAAQQMLARLARRQVCHSQQWSSILDVWSRHLGGGPSAASLRIDVAPVPVPPVEAAIKPQTDL